jgi:hypothetical protein
MLMLTAKRFADRGEEAVAGTGKPRKSCWLFRISFVVSRAGKIHFPVMF